MIEPAEPELSRRALDEEVAFDRIEKTHAFGIERVSPNRILSRQERQVRKLQVESKAMGVHTCGLIAVSLADHTVDRSAIDTNDSDGHAGRASVG